MKRISVRHYRKQDGTSVSAHTRHIDSVPSREKFEKPKAYTRGSYQSVGKNKRRCIFCRKITTRQEGLVGYYICSDCSRRYGEQKEKKYIAYTRDKDEPNKWTEAFTVKKAEKPKDSKNLKWVESGKEREFAKIKDVHRFKKYDFEKELTKDSLQMTRIKKKYKNHKFKPDELVGFD